MRGQPCENNSLDSEVGVKAAEFWCPAGELRATAIGEFLGSSPVLPGT